MFRFNYAQSRNETARCSTQTKSRVCSIYIPMVFHYPWYPAIRYTIWHLIPPILNLGSQDLLIYNGCQSFLAGDYRFTLPYSLGERCQSRLSVVHWELEKYLNGLRCGINIPIFLQCSRSECSGRFDISHPEYLRIQPLDIIQSRPLELVSPAIIPMSSIIVNTSSFLSKCCSRSIL